MIRRLLSNSAGTAGVEIVFVLPMMLILMLGSLELGNFFYSEHILIKGLRDGAVYAARRDAYDCTSGTPTVSSGATDDTKSIVRSGQITGGTDRLPNWGSATFSVNVSCATSAGGTTMGGLYTQSAGKVPIVRVVAQVPYQSMVGSLGFNVANLSLTGSQEAVGTGT